MNARRRLSVTVSLLVSLGVAGCTSQTTDNFENPPPGPPAACTANPAVAGCTGGSLGYTCANDRPDHGDTNLVCSDGTPGAAGMTLFCCAPYGQAWSDCTVDTSIVGCDAESFGFTCSGPEAPYEADASLACSEGTPSGGDTLYCCNSAVVPPACVACQADGAGCSGASDCCSGRCGGQDASTCAPPTCGTNAPDEPCACLADDQACSAGVECCSQICLNHACLSVGCPGPTIGYSCAGGATPEELDPALVCGAGTSGRFCCAVGAQ
jgi:hypothetical protein